MIASFRAEILKIRKRWANWILFLALLLIVLLLGYVLVYLIYTNPPPRGIPGDVSPSTLKRSVFPENLLANLFASIRLFGPAIMIIFGGLSMASEYGWGTIQTVLIQRPGRLALLLGKLLALTLVSLLVSVALAAAVAGASYFFVKVDGSTSTWPAADVLLRGFGALWLQFAVWTLFGMFLGLAFRSTAAAIGGGLTYLIVELLVGGILGNTPGLKEVLKFLPGVNATAITAAFPYAFRSAGLTTVGLVSATRGTITLLIYLALFVVLGALIFRRRDVGA